MIKNKLSFFAFPLLIFFILANSESHADVDKLDMNDEGIKLSKQLSDQEVGRVESGRTVSLIDDLLSTLNSYYLSNKKYPTIREWPLVAKQLGNKVKVNIDSLAVYDAYGSSLQYVPVSTDEIWLMSINIFDVDESGNEKVVIYKSVRGNVDLMEYYEP